jgi:small basic protein
MLLTIKKIQSWIIANPWLGEAAVFLVCFAIYWPLQNNGVFPDPDSFYHLKMAELIAARGPIRVFFWLPFTTLAKNFADQHFLYHIALIPFIKVFGPLRGMKIATAAFAAAAIAAVSFVLRRFGLKLAPLLALVLAVMNPFVFRISLAKASAPGIILLVLGMYFAVRRKSLPLFLVAFFYVWTHGGWPALLGLGSVAIVVSSWDKNIPATFRKMRTPLAMLWLGTVAGLVINPFFPNNFQFYWEQIVQIAVINYQTKIGVGAEWYPYNPADLVGGLSLLFLSMAAAVVVWPFGKGNRRPALAYSIGTFAFLILTLRSRRHVEYFVPLAFIASLLWLDSALRPFIKKFFSNYRLVACAVVLAMISMLAVFSGGQIGVDHNDLDVGYDFNLYKGETDWLKANVPAGEIIVHSNWDDFTPLFLNDDTHRYIMGLDPTFLYSANPVLYWKYVDFTLGKSADPAQTMGLLDSHYVLLDKKHDVLKNLLVRSKKFTLVYQDNDGYIYKLK